MKERILKISFLLYFLPIVSCYASSDFMFSGGGRSQQQNESVHCYRLISFIAVDKNRGYEIKVTKGQVRFGGYGSCELIERAWLAFEQMDFEDVLVYTNKCLELYTEQASKQQNDLMGFPPKEDAIHFDALNAVGTANFLQGEAYSRLGMVAEAKNAYQKVVADYSFTQAYNYDTGEFLKVADEAKVKLQAMDK